MSERVVVVGGGPVGLACAWEAQRRGRDVVVLDAGGDGAWCHAAGMLAPVTEAEFGEQALLALGLRSAAAYPAFCASLPADAGYRETGTLVVARDADEAAAIDRLHAFRLSLGLAAERLRPSQARRAEGALAPTVRLALDVPGDHSVDPQALVRALRAGLDVRTATVADVRPDAAVLDTGEIVAGRVVLAAGLGSAALGGLPVRPVKGQVLRLRDPRGPGLVTRSIRTEHAYLVPRADGGYVLGATMEERGFDTAPTAGAVFELVRDMSEVVPGVLELELEAVTAGLRPGTPDNLPLIGERADGLLVATGHGRNGILLAPVTGQLVAGLLDGEPLPDWARACAPERLGVPA